MSFMDQPSMRVLITPCTRAEALKFVRAHHSHHREKSQAADIFRIRAHVGGETVAVAIMGAPCAPGLQDGETWEVTRTCVGPTAPRHTASRLLGACGRVMDSAGVTLGVSYTRVDERGSSYLAAGWLPVSYVVGRKHDTGNRSLRLFAELYKPSTEIVDRVRWERGPRSQRRDRMKWNGARWVIETKEGQVSE